MNDTHSNSLTGGDGVGQRYSFLWTGPEKGDDFRYYLLWLLKLEEVAGARNGNLFKAELGRDKRVDNARVPSPL